VEHTAFLSTRHTRVAKLSVYHNASESRHFLYKVRVKTVGKVKQISWYTTKGRHTQHQGGTNTRRVERNTI